MTKLAQILIRSFHLIERDLVIRALVKLGSTRALVGGHGLRVLDERALVFKVGRDSGC
jgi:hypothetical protein